MEEGSIALLSSDVLITIFSFVSPADLLRVAQVSQRFAKLSSSDRLWKAIYEDIHLHFRCCSFEWIRGRSDDFASFKAKCFAKTLPADVNLEWKAPVEKVAKVVVVGDTGVGKTSLLFTWRENAFPKDYMPSNFDNYTTKVEFHTHSISVSLVDTNGCEAYGRLRPLYYPDTNLFLVCFSVDSSSSFRSVRSQWVAEVEKVVPGTKTMLVATKTDLRTKSEAPITTQEGIALAKELKFDAYCECSALTSPSQVRDVFNTAYTCLFMKLEKKAEEHRKCAIC
jgi:small GTP-binding protein